MLDVGSLVEIRCHPTCPWTGGWQICEVVATDGDHGYRVRRVGLVRPLLATLPEADVRPANVPALGRAG